MINGKGDVIYWVVECWNRWCYKGSGIGIVGEKPAELIHCLSCGYPISLNCGITEHSIPYRFRGDISEVELIGSLC